MATPDWVERRQRMVRCKPHGLHYDPELATGCALCLKEAAAKAQPARPPQLVIILLCLLGMAFIVFWIFGPGRDESAGAIDLGVASSSAVAVERLDPELFRPRIEAFETALFRLPIQGTGDLLAVSAETVRSARELSEAVLEAAPQRGLELADQVARIGQAMPTDQVILNDVLLARSEWLRLRKRHLEPASWFHQPTGKAPTEVDLSRVDYGAIASDLRALLTDATQAVETGGESWAQTRADLLDRLRGLERRLPRRPDPRADARLLLAIQDLERALAQTRELLSDPALPTSTTRDRRLDDAFASALRAEQTLDEL